MIFKKEAKLMADKLSESGFKLAMVGIGLTVEVAHSVNNHLVQPAFQAYQVVKGELAKKNSTA